LLLGDERGIKITRKELEYGTHIIDEDGRLLDYEGIRIKNGQEDIADILVKIKKSFINLDGVATS